MNFSALTILETTEDRDELLEVVDLLLSGLYQKKEKTFESILESQVPLPIRNAIRKDLTDFQIEKDNYLNQLKLLSKKMQIVTLTIAFSPSYTTINTISALIKKKYGELTLIECGYAPSIIAGVTVVYDGKYYDFSVRKKFDQVMDNLRENL